ncbi:hypothetical protein BaRGS_00001272 [Batillaria attramentaria]|uniref:Uncharacterized protein n=1 Tax=Batillaria attramentaria TaxID=370345 RepID=A0ABD0M744_9CAEN
MATESQRNDVAADAVDLELQLDLMTINCFESINNDDVDDLEEELFITCCYGRGKRLQDIVIPRLPKKYESEAKKPPSGESVLYESRPLMKSPAVKKRTVGGRGRARLLKDQLQGAQSRLGPQQTQTLPSSFSREAKSECILIDQDFDVYGGRLSGSTAIGAGRYNVRSQEDFPSLSTVTDSESGQGKNKRKRACAEVQSFESLGKQIATLGMSGDNGGTSGAHRVGPEGDASFSDTVSQLKANRMYELSFDDDVDGIFDDVTVEDNDALFEPLRKEDAAVPYREASSAAENPKAASVTGMGQNAHSKDMATSLLAMDELDDTDIETCDSGKDGSQTYADRPILHVPHQTAACFTSDSGLEHSHNGQTSVEFSQPTTSDPGSAAVSESSGQNDLAANAEKGSSDSSTGAEAAQGAKPRKVKSKKTWKLEGSDVFQVDNVPKGGGKELEDLLSHYGKILEKEKKARTGGKYSFRFRISGETENMEWITECFHDNDDIFPGCTLECYHLNDLSTDDGTEV